MTPMEQIAALADVALNVEAQLAQSTMTIREVLALDAGSVVKTSRPAGENVDVLIGGVLVGSGEVVVMEEKVGVRMTSFRTPA